MKMRKVACVILTAALACFMLCLGCGDPTPAGPKAPEQPLAQGDVCTRIDIKRMPDKTEYRLGERFDPTGLLFDAAYENGYGGDNGLPADELDGWTPFGALTSDVTLVTVRYKGVQKSIGISVIKRTFLSMSITREPFIKTYSPGAAISFEGLVVTAVYDDGSNDAVTDYMITDDDGNIYREGTPLPEAAGEIALNVSVTIDGNTASAPLTVRVNSGQKIVVEAEAFAGTPLPTDESYTVLTGKGKKEEAKDTDQKLTGDVCISDADIGTKIDFYVYSEKAVKGAMLVLTAASLDRGDGQTYDSRFNDIFSLSVDGKTVAVASTAVIAGRKAGSKEKIWFLWTENEIASVDLRAGYTKITLACIGKITDRGDKSQRAANIDKIAVKF